MRRLRKPTVIAVLLAAGVGVTIWLDLRDGGPEADFTAADFHEAYRDRKAATDRFAGRSIAVRGPVESVKHTIMTPYHGQTVFLGDERVGVICNFRPERVHEANRLFVGQLVVVRGTCAGDFGGFPILTDCTVEGASYMPTGIGRLWGP